MHEHVGRVGSFREPTDSAEEAIRYCSFVALAAVAVAGGDRTSGLLLGAVLASSFASGAIRALSVGDLAPRLKEPIQQRLWAFALLSPVASALTVYAFLRSALSRRIEWRGKPGVGAHRRRRSGV